MATPDPDALSGDPQHKPDTPRRPQNDPEIQRLLQQLVSKRTYPHGRIGADDEGETAIGIAVDKKHNVIRIQFANPTSWLALNKAKVAALIAMLTSKMNELS